MNQNAGRQTILSRGMELLNAKDYRQLEELIRGSITQHPNDFQIRNLYGIALRRLGRFDAAVEQFTAAKRLKPGSMMPLANLGSLYLDRLDGKSAESQFRLAIRLQPKDSELFRLLSRALALQGKVDQAVSACRHALALKSDNVAVIDQLAELLLRAGRAKEALAVAANAAGKLADPQYRIVHARVLRKMGQVDAARNVLEALIAEHPNAVASLLALGQLLEDSNRPRANDLFSRALALEPDNPSAMERLCDSLNRSRYDNEAAHIERAYQIACTMVDRFPGDVIRMSRVLRNVLQRCIDFDRLEQVGPRDACIAYWLTNSTQPALLLELSKVETTADRYRLIEQHREWGRRIEARISTRLATVRPARRSKLRVGFMSSDLRNHPVSYFALPLLEHYDRERFEVFCYSFYQREEDRVQRHITTKVDAFRWLKNRSDADIAQAIYDDALDILFDLGGPTDMNRPEIMAYRPAAVQASWLGYPHSTGLSTVDYIVVDPFVMPADRKLLVEKPLCLAHTWVVLSPLGFADEPIASTLPEAQAGHLTFGTMNNPYKYSPAMLDTWAEVVRAVPGSRLLFVRPEGGVAAFRKNLRRFFAARGVESDRLQFSAIRGTHLRHYNAIDISLDTFPHTGGTTTCETLWMGVPVVSLVGPAFFERMSFSNLSNAGLSDLCAYTREEYVTKAVALAADRSRRQHLRDHLRQQIGQTPLGRPLDFMADFYRATERALS
jgi:protein O-GlcNAc transferase